MRLKQNLAKPPQRRSRGSVGLTTDNSVRPAPPGPLPLKMLRDTSTQSCSPIVWVYVFPYG